MAPRLASGVAQTRLLGLRFVGLVPVAKTSPAVDWRFQRESFLNKQSHQVIENIRWSPINGQINPNIGHCLEE